MDLLGLRYKLSFLVHSEFIQDLSEYIRQGRTLTTLFGERDIHINRAIGYHHEDQTVYTLYEGEGIQIEFEIEKGYTFQSSNGRFQTTDWEELKQTVVSYFASS